MILEWEKSQIVNCLLIDRFLKIITRTDWSNLRINEESIRNVKFDGGRKSRDRPQAPDLRGALKSLPTSEGGKTKIRYRSNKSSRSERCPEISSQIRRGKNNLKSLHKSEEEKTLSAPKSENRREIVGNPKRKNWNLFPNPKGGKPLSAPNPKGKNPFSTKIGERS